MTRKFSTTQIAKCLKAAGLNQIEAPENEQFSRVKTFWFEGRDLIVVDDATKNKALKALREVGRMFGGYRCGTGAWTLREGYCISETSKLISSNID